VCGVVVAGTRNSLAPKCGAQADADGDGKVSLFEFLKLFTAILEFSDEFLLAAIGDDGSMRKTVPSGVLRRAASLTRE